MIALSESALRRFQDAFAQALSTPDTGEIGVGVAALTAQHGFAIYRNTVMKGCIDALQANFPSVERLVGGEWFRSAAAVYVRERLPDAPMLLHYGHDFPEFLAGFRPAAELPYLSSVARLDRQWTEAYASRDEKPLDAGSVAALDGNALAHCVWRPHPSARWSFFDSLPVVTIWRRNRYDAVVDLSDLIYEPEGVLIVRPGSEVVNIDIDAAACAFLDACHRGESLPSAVERSLAIDAHFNLTRLLARLLRIGAFAEARCTPLGSGMENTL